MKKIKFEGKLSLNKETIAKLNDDQMNVIKGGAQERMTRLFCKSHYTSKCVGCECDSCPSPGML